MEVLVGCLSVLQGKVKRLDCLHIFRQHHQGRYGAADFYDWMTSPQWATTYGGFRDCLLEELVRQDRLSPEEAREVVKRAFWPWLANRLMSRWRKREGLDGRRRLGHLREVARRIPILKEAWRAIRSRMPGEEAGVSLPALLRPSSPYYRDFLPIYHTITNPRSQGRGDEVSQHLSSSDPSMRRVASLQSRG
jgi:hypothetical protein